MLLSEIKDRSVASALAPLLAAHLALAVTFDLAARPVITLCVLTFAFVSYWRAVRRLELAVTAPVIMLVAILLRLLLLALPPTLSDDVLRYTWDGKVVRAGFNPYLLAPKAPELEPLRDELWEQMPHKHVPTVYPPLALALFSLASWLPNPLVGVKILLCSVELGGCWLLIGLARRLGLPPGRAAWYCWSPLACLEVAGMGHVDAMVVTASVATVWLLTEDKRPLAATAGAAAGAAAGVLSKLVPLLPMWARQSGRPLTFLTTALGLTAVAMLPICLSVGGVPPGLVTYGISWEFNGPLYEPLWRLLDRLELADAIKRGLDELKSWSNRHDFWNRLYPFVYPQLLAKLALAGGFGWFLLNSLRRRLPAEKHAVIGTGQLMGGLILCTATVYPWYLLWVLPWAALARQPAWLTLSMLMPLAYVPQLFGVALFPWIYSALWGPFFLLLVASTWIPEWRWTID